MIRLTRPGQPLPPAEAPRHLIAQYTHQARSVVCTCGYTGSSVSPDREPSEWTRHITANRPARL